MKFCQTLFSSPHLRNSHFSAVTSLLYHISSILSSKQIVNWNLFLFFSIYSLSSTSSTKCIQSFLRSLTSKASVKSCSPSASLHPAPCIGVPQLSASGFTHSFEFLNAAFPRATALLLYTLFLILSTLFLVEDFYWILSINCVIYTKQVVFNRFFRKMRGFLCWNGVRIVFLGKTLCVRFGMAGAHPQLALGIAIAPETLTLITTFWF